MYLTQDKVARQYFTGFFATLRMTLLGNVETESAAVWPKTTPPQTQTIMFALLSSRIECSEMRDLGILGDWLCKPSP